MADIQSTATEIRRGKEKKKKIEEEEEDRRRRRRKKLQGKNIMPTYYIGRP